MNPNIPRFLLMTSNHHFSLFISNFGLTQRVFDFESDSWLLLVTFQLGIQQA